MQILGGRDPIESLKLNKEFAVLAQQKNELCENLIICKVNPASLAGLKIKSLWTSPLRMREVRARSLPRNTH